MTVHTLGRFEPLIALACCLRWLTLTRFRVVDIETTGLKPPAEVIEFGRADVVFDEGVSAIERPMARLYRPLNEIPPENMAVHHLTLADFTPEMPVAANDLLHKAIWGGSTPDVLVAHNCAFEQMFLTSEVTDPLPWICTYKAAAMAWPQAPSHSNQVLRYWLGLDLPADLAMPPHRAGPDAWVTANILAELLKVASVEDMLAWTNLPTHMPVINFGKHKGIAWEEVPSDYLAWLKTAEAINPDARWYAEQELERRSK